MSSFIGERFTIANLEGQWISFKGVVHTIRNGALIWGNEQEGTSSEPLPFRHDSCKKHGKNHFSVGRKQRRGPPGNLRRCILRSRCELEWTSPTGSWKRYLPFIAATKTVKLARSSGQELSCENVSELVNMEQLRMRAWNRFARTVSCVTADILITETDTGRILDLESDFSAAGDPVDLTVSTHLAELISSRRLELILPGGEPLDVDLSGVVAARDLFSRLASSTSRPDYFVDLYQLQEDGTRTQVTKFSILNALLPHVTIEVRLTETIEEFWLRKRLVLAHADDGKPFDIDLAKVCAASDLLSALGVHTGRPSRFVRCLLPGGEELKWWKPEEQFAEGEEVTLRVELARTVHELLLEHAVRVVNCFSGQVLPLDPAAVSSLVSVQDLREAIARLRGGIRATNVKLLTPAGQQLWDAEPFDLNAFGHGETISVCFRDPQLCAQGQCELVCFADYGWNDVLCIHCGSESSTQGRLRQPMRERERRQGFLYNSDLQQPLLYPVGMGTTPTT